MGIHIGLSQHITELQEVAIVEYSMDHFAVEGKGGN